MIAVGFVFPTIAIDSFKGSMDSIEAGVAAAEGVKRVYPDAETVVYPLADGGEGTVQALAKGLDGKLEQDRKSTRLNSSHVNRSRMPSSA